MKIENTVTVKHTGDDRADGSPLQRSHNGRHSKDFNSTGRNLQAMIQKRTYRNISSHVRKHKINAQSGMGSSSNMGQMAPSNLAIDSLRQKLASKRTGYLSHKLAMIQEEIERANSGQEGDQTTDDVGRALAT